MTAFLDAAKVAQNNLWIARVNMIALDNAVDVMAEDAGTADHAVREILARAIIRNDSSLASVLPRTVLANETVRAGAVADIANFGAAVPDSDLQYTVSTIWTSVAKALFG